MRLAIIITIILVLVLTMSILYLIFRPKNDAPQPTPLQPKYKGIVLFDIDGTLTDQGHSGEDNAKLVQICLDTGFAVGINTAGGYTPDLWQNWPPDQQYNWMPKNLVDFMKAHNWNTFNAVRIGYLNGKVDQQAYVSIDKNIPPNIDPFGWRKGFALEQTAKLYGITNPECIIMFDDLPSFIDGMLAWNPNFNVNCINYKTCGGLTEESVRKALIKCS